MACAPDTTLSLYNGLVVFSTAGMQVRVDGGHCILHLLPAGMIHRGLIELSNIDIPLKTLRVYAVMVKSRVSRPRVREHPSGCTRFSAPSFDLPSTLFFEFLSIYLQIVLYQFEISLFLS